MATTRDNLIETMKQLLWERGYDATSPNLVLERSGAGKGSFYHHFKGKKELAIAAMESRSDELIEEFDRVTAKPDLYLEKVYAYLRLPRDATRGCRMGRIVQDPSLDDPLLNAPLERYFKHLHERLTWMFEEAQRHREMMNILPPGQLATLALSALQGGFVLGRATGEGAAADDATGALMALLSTQTLRG